MANRILGATVFAVLVGTSAIAQESSIRFVRAPEAGQTGPRITIQITEEDMVRQGAPIAPAPAPDVATAVALPALDGASSWFWAEVPSQMPADPARFWAALELLSRAPEIGGLGAPRLDTVSQIAARHGREILAATIGTQVSPAFALAVIAAESAGRSDAVSGAGAQGLMQLIPATAERFGVADAMDPAQNIAGGVAYLDWLMAEFDRDPILVLAAYNAGEGAVVRAGGVPEYDETRTYVPRVLAAWDMARGLCNTPPELVSDGCVFQMMN
jgi:soluble lytic murein transglycosylase-like protein